MMCMTAVLQLFAALGAVGLTAEVRAQERQYERVLTIGDESRPDYVFGRIADAAQRANGEVVVLDGMNALVRIYSPSGEFIRRFGGLGAGPGEFMLPNHLLLTPHHIIVMDARLQRASKFTYEGALVETIGGADQPVTAGAMLPMRDGAWVAVKTNFRVGVAQIEQIVSVPASGREQVRQEQRRQSLSAVLTWSGSRHVPDTIFRFDPGFVFYYESSGARFGILPKGVGSAGAWTIAGDSLFGYVDGENGDVRVFKAENGRLRLLKRGRVPLEPAPVTTAHVRALEAEMRALLSLPPSIELSVPRFHPLLGSPKFAPDGALWVRRLGQPGNETERGHRYMVIPLDDRQQHDVVLPEGLTLTSVGNASIVGTRQDELGIQSVEVWRRKQ